MSLENYSYLWDGSESGWYLQRIEHTMWQVTFTFSDEGPSKEEILKIHKFLPEMKREKLPVVLRSLRGKSQFTSSEYFGNIEARKLESEALNLGLHIELKLSDQSGYLPIQVTNEGSFALVIEDDQLAKLVAEKMIQEGVKVEVIHHD